VIVLDIALPGMNELAMQLRALPETVSVKLIALSGYGQEWDRLGSAARRSAPAQSAQELRLHWQRWLIVHPVFDNARSPLRRRMSEARPFRGAHPRSTAHATSRSVKPLMQFSHR